MNNPQDAFSAAAFAQRLASALGQRQCSQSQLASALGISRSTRRALTAAELLASDRAFNELVGNFCEAYGVAYGAGMAPEKGYLQCVIAVRDA